MAKKQTIKTKAKPLLVPPTPRKMAKPCVFPGSWLFFMASNQFFTISAHRDLRKEDLRPLNPDLASKKIFEEMIEQSRNPPPLKPKIMKDGHLIQPNKSCTDIIYPLIRGKLIYAVIIKAIESFIILCLSQLPKYFIREIRQGPQANPSIIYGIPALACFLVIVRQLL